MHDGSEGGGKKERGENQRLFSSSEGRDDHRYGDDYNGSGQGMSERVMQRQIGLRSKEKAERVGIRNRATGECGQNNGPSAARKKNADQSEGQEYVGEQIHS